MQKVLGCNWGSWNSCLGCPPPPPSLRDPPPQPSGLLLQEETQSEHKSIHYLKLSTPWEVLVYYAEELCMRAPLQVSPGLFFVWCFGVRYRSSASSLSRHLGPPDLLFLCQAHPNPDRNSSDDLLRKLRIPNLMDQRVPNKPVDYFTCAFRKSKLDR